MKSKIKTFLNKYRDILGWRLLDSYILKKFLGSFVYSIALLMTIIIVFDVSENIQSFMDKNVPFSEIVFKYYLNFIPYFINLFIPLFTFISVIWFTSSLSQQNEIIAILGSGINFYRFMVPYIAGALIIASLSLVFANLIIPHTNENFNNFKQEYFIVRHASRSNIHVKTSPNTYVYVDRWNRNAMEGHQFTYECFSDEMISYKIKARSIKYNPDNQTWRLENYSKRTIRDSIETVEVGKTMDTVFNIEPNDFNKDVKVIETMTYENLQDYIKEEKAKGSSYVNYYLIEKNKRIANPMGTIIMTLLGLSVASRKTRRGIGVHLFFGIALAFIFIFLQQISDVFAISGSIFPALGAWIPDIIFLIICIFMIKYTQK